MSIQNSLLVQEVVDFAAAGNLLGGKGGIHESWVALIELDEAKHLAWDAPLEDNALCWVDLRERQMSEVRASLHDNASRSEIQSAITEMLVTITANIRKRIDRKHQDLLDDIVGDLYCCALNRAVNGPTGFFEELFRAYQAGGWPCGWTERFSKGQLNVYFRQLVGHARYPVHD